MMVSSWRIVNDNVAIRLLRGGDAAFETKIMEFDLSPEITTEGQRALRASWWRKHGMRVKRLPVDNDKNPGRQLRIGYCSGDFKFHSACTLFASIVLQHNSGFIPFCYSSMEPYIFDETTEVFKNETNWRDVYTLSDRDMARAIQADRIDILVDLSGFTPRNRLPVFAMKPAPVQVHGWGYGIPTGFPCFDGFFADKIMLPPEDRHGIEPAIDLPCLLSYPDRTVFPEANDLPERAPVFGCFNRHRKIDEACVRLWGHILDRIPGSTIILKSGDYTEEKISMISGILGDRAIFQGGSTAAEHVRVYHDVDLSLDPLVQNGGVSSLESLWMGVPVLTLPGKQTSNRITYSMLSVLDLTGFVASDENDYIEKAVAWVTTRRGELAALRKNLRSRMRESVLSKGYIEAVEQAYRKLWKEWCHAY
jgi:predicted O-linked N-acetylglucosamine transferase (SPINDLY family)